MKQPTVLTIREAWMKASSFLQSAGVEDGNSAAEQLLCHVLDRERTALFLHWSEPFPEPRRAAWQEALRRRAAGEPTQYITGMQHFYGEAFQVNPSVLIPRPETELLVEAIVQEGRRLWPPGGAEAGPTGAPASALPERPEAAQAPHEGRLLEPATPQERPEAARAPREGRLPQPATPLERPEAAQAPREGRPSRTAAPPKPAPVRAREEGPPPPTGPCPAAPHAVDVGTGSGIIAVTLARLCPEWRVTAIDISPAALRTASENAASHRVADRVRLVRGDLLQPLLDERAAADIIVSNPPYIETSVIPRLQREVRDHEPRTALDGGADGMRFYRRLVEQMKRLPRLPRLVGFETGAGQAPRVAELLDACAHWQEIRIVRDLAGIDRHVVAVRLETASLEVL